MKLKDVLASFEAARSGQSASAGPLGVAEMRLILYIHALLVENDFRAVGLSSSGPTQEPPEDAQWQLPVDWQQAYQSEIVVLRYRNIRSSLVFLMKIIPMGDDMLVHASVVGIDGTRVSLVLKTADYVAVRDDLAAAPISSDVVQNEAELRGAIQERIVNPLLSRVSQGEAATQTPGPSGGSSGSISGFPRAAGGGNRGGDEDRRSHIGPYPNPVPTSVGADDLLPAGLPRYPAVGPLPFPSAGGGSIVGPRHPMFDNRRDDPLRIHDEEIQWGLPRGSIPPGARFDPFGPPGLPTPDQGTFPFAGGRRAPPRPAPPTRPPGGEPEPDHLRPPQFNYFM